MFGAFLDESFDNNNAGVFAVAAVFGDGWQILKAEGLWQEKLAQYSLSSFKSSSMRRKPAVVADFAQVIARSGLIGCGLVTEQAAVRKHLSDSRFHKQYKESPYMIAYQTLFISIAMDLIKGNSRRCVSYVCDGNARYLAILTRSFSELKKLNPESAKFMGSCTTALDDNCVPLQMADLIAGELRKAGILWREDCVDLSRPMRILLDGVLWKVKHLDQNGLETILQPKRVQPG